MLHPASPVDAKGPRRGDCLLQNVGDALRVVLGLDQCQPAKLSTSTRDRVALNMTGLHRESAVVEGRLSQELGELLVWHVGKDRVLLHRQPDFALRVLVGEIRELARLDDGQPAAGDMDANATESLLCLLVNAKQLASGEGLRCLGLRLVPRGAATVRLHFLLHFRAKGLQTLLLNEPHQPSLLAVAT
eukprot:scaffold264052_cov30-Tisochrysis_lutea.AAC.2